MPTDTKWLFCKYCGCTMPHIKTSNGAYRCTVDHERTQIALNRIKSGKDLKKKPKGGGHDEG